MTTTIEIVSKQQGAVLKQYRDSRERVTAIMGPLGSGKTIESCQKLLDLMCEQKPNKQGVRPSRFVAVRNTFPDLTSTTIKDWLGLFSDLGRFVGGGMEPPTHHIHFQLKDGTEVKAELIFLALDRAESVKKLRGVQCTGFWLNEMKELPKAIVDMADLRHGRYPSKATGGVNCTWHGMIGDTNAPDEDHWYYHLAEVDRPEGWVFLRQPGGVFPVGDQFEVNPNAENVKNLPDGYYPRGMAGKSNDWIKINLANEYGYVSDGKPIYPEYVDSVHCLKEEYIPNPEWPIILGIDFGRTPACALIQFNPSMGRYVGFDEFVTEDMSASLFAPELKSYLDRTYPNFKFARSGGDPAGQNKAEQTELTSFKILWKNGLQVVQPCHTNDPLVRRSSIINPMTRLCMDGKPAFMISPKCKQWRKGLQGGFCYKRIQVAGDERYRDEPDKNKYSHVCEAGEYGLLQAGEGRAAVTPSDNTFQAPVTADNFSVF
ncbi:TerL [bacterium]|nr:TerL [bacterium]